MIEGMVRPRGRTTVSIVSSVTLMKRGMAMRGGRSRAAGVTAIAGVAVMLAGVGWVVAGDDSAAKGGVEAKAVFARLKTMAGTWKAELLADGKAADFKKKVEEHKGGHPDQASVIYKLTGAGSALVETQMVGMPHEMVSVYHLDGDDLRMTHYCAAGNQPRMKLDKGKSRPDHLIFVFDGGSNLDPAKDIHIHGMELTFHEDGRVTSAWEGYKGDKPFGTTAFVMTRASDPAH
jgi:hypothetical protein